MTLTERILSATPGAQERWPQWFRAVPKCPYCGGVDVVRAAHLHCLNRECDRAFPETDEYAIEYIGPDLTRPESLHYLLEVADAIGGESEQISEFVPFAIPKMRHKHTICAGRQRDWHEGTGPTRTAAVIAACCAALGVEP